MKTPFEHASSTFKENLEQGAEQDRSAQQFLDGFMIWIIGFSVGSIALLIGNIENLSKQYDYWMIKLILVSLALSIIGGILHRILLFDFKNKYNTTVFQVLSCLPKKDIMNIFPVDTSSIKSMEELIYVFQRDYGLDYTREMQLYNSIETEHGKKVIFNNLLERYTWTNQWAVRAHEEALQSMQKLLTEFGLYVPQKEDAKSPDFQKLNKIQAYVLYASCLFFILAIVITVAGF